MRIVIDTNVVVSAIFFGGKPKDLLELVFNKKIDAYATKDIIVEYNETAKYLCKKYPSKKVAPPLAAIAGMMTVIEPVSKISVCRDPDDNKFIECALDAKCKYIVSGDKDLLTLKEYAQIQIMTVSDFMASLKL